MNHKESRIADTLLTVIENEPRQEERERAVLTYGLFVQTVKLRLDLEEWFQSQEP